jgi:tyrosyl-tRNA synthetase
MYPLLQGFDSFAVKSDIELGGVDQKFNVSIGRVIQKQFDSDNQQVGMLMPILIGTDGKEKMSKSLNNTIGIDEHPLNMFSKLEKIPDNIVDDFILLLTDLDTTNLPSNPREKQKLMAVEVVSTIHGEEEAKNALKNSEAIIVSGETEVIAEEIAFEEIKLPILLANLLKDINFTKSTSDARRLITSGAIKIDGIKITDEKHTIIKFGQLLQVSRKRFFRLIAK